MQGDPLALAVRALNDALNELWADVADGGGMCPALRRRSSKIMDAQNAAYAIATGRIGRSPSPTEGDADA